MSTPWTASSIERLLAFLPALEQGPFHEEAGGYRRPNERLAAFGQALYETGIVFPFDWSSWARGDGEALVAGRSIETANLDDVRRAITTHVRADRFTEGHLLQVVEDGRMAALIRRLGQLRVSAPWSFRIGTWNVERAPRSRRDRQRQEVAGADADVWVLTETHDALDLHPAYRPVSSRAHGQGERWVTVWSRLPLLGEVAVRDTVRTAAALYEGPAGPILVYGTVLPWHADRGPDGRARNWTEHHRVIPEQAAECAELAAGYPTATLCVAGDYNMELGGRPRAYGTARGRALLESGLAAAGLRCVTRTVDGLARPPIDHISLRGPGRTTIARAWEGTIAGERLSDHSAVVVQVDGPATPPPPPARTFAPPV